MDYQQNRHIFPFLVQALRKVKNIRNVWYTTLLRTLQISRKNRKLITEDYVLKKLTKKKERVVYDEKSFCEQ